jgi:hypothetical protein
LESVLRGWGLYVETVVGSNREATDFLGFATEDGSYTPIKWAARLAERAAGTSEPRSVLLLDEFGGAPEIQRAQQRVVQERWVGELHLEGVRMVAIANPARIATDGWTLSMPVANRFVHLTWDFQTEAWLDGFAIDFEQMEYEPMEKFIHNLEGDEMKSHRMRFRSGITTFLRGNHLLEGDLPTHHEDPVIWPSPRSWTNAARAAVELRPKDHEAMSLIFAGAVGRGAATEFMQWYEANDLYDIPSVLRDPSIVNWNSGDDRLFALAQGLESFLRSKTHSDSFVNIWNRTVKVMISAVEAGRSDVISARLVPHVEALRPAGSVWPDEFSDSMLR